MQRRISPRPRFFMFVIVFMLLCFTVSGVASQLHYSQVSERVTGLTAERVALSSRVKQLNSRLVYVRSDDYVERVARDELNMIMPGEIRYVSN